MPVVRIRRTLSAGEKVGLNDEQKQIVEFDIGETVKAMAGAGRERHAFSWSGISNSFSMTEFRPIGCSRLLLLQRPLPRCGDGSSRRRSERGEADLRRELYTAWIMNFHQFSFRIISENAPEFRIDPDVGVSTDVDNARIRTALFRRFQSGRSKGCPMVLKRTCRAG